jgi:hypothetical protein
MKIQGGCHCGDITFTAEIDPDTASICHCTDCQTLSGSAFRTSVRTHPGTFEFLSGTPTLYIKTAESGTKREHAFCSRCGTAIYATSPGPQPQPKTHSLRLGTLRPRDAVEPKRQVWTRSRVAWLERMGALVGTEKQG